MFIDTLKKVCIKAIMPYRWEEKFSNHLYIENTLRCLNVVLTALIIIFFLSALLEKNITYLEDHYTISVKEHFYERKIALITLFYCAILLFKAIKVNYRIFHEHNLVNFFLHSYIIKLDRIANSPP